jgi:hypothetical protein
MSFLQRVKMIAKVAPCILSVGLLAGCADAYYGTAAPGWSADVNGYYGPDYYYSTPDYFGYYDPGYSGYYGGIWAPGFYDNDHHFHHGYRHDIGGGRSFGHRSFLGRGNFDRGHATFGARAGFAHGGGARGGFGHGAGHGTVAHGSGGGHSTGGHSSGRGHGR